MSRRMHSRSNVNRDRGQWESASDLATLGAVLYIKRIMALMDCNALNNKSLVEKDEEREGGYEDLSRTQTASKYRRNVRTGKITILQ